MENQDRSERWGIVGGGMLGLMLAHRLQARGQKVTVLEAAPFLGGLASAWRIGDLTWDRHYHVILMSDLRVRELLQEIGLQDELEFVETKTGFYTNGRLYSMSNSLEFLQFPPLGLIDKFRLALTIIRASKIKDWQKLEEIPVTKWLEKWSGRRTLEKIWLPLLRAKLGENYKIASASFIWAIIARMYAARRSGLKKEMFGYVRGGYARVLDQFVESLKSRGVLVFPRQTVEKIETTHSGVRVQLEDDQLHFDRVIFTGAAPLASRLCPDLTAEEHRKLNGITYQGIVCSSMVLKKKLAHYYVTNITDTWVPFTAVIEMSALVKPEHLHGRHLVYLPKYVDPSDPIFTESDHEIQERFLSAIERMYPKFSRSDVLAFRVSRVKQVFAVSTLSYSKSVPPVVTSQEGLYLLNSAHILNGTLNVNETLQLADTALPQILAAPTPTWVRRREYLS